MTRWNRFSAESKVIRNRYRKAERYADLFRAHGVPAQAIPLVTEDQWQEFAASLGIDVPSDATIVVVEEMLRSDSRTSPTLPIAR